MPARELVATPDDLLERERELAALAGAIAHARQGSGRVVVVEGPAGIGKSQLLTVAGARARAEGVRVLRTRGAELERDVSFGAAAELFSPTLAGATAAESARLLDGQAGLAASLFGTSAPALAEPLALNRGLYGLTANLASAGPLVLVLDDAQWADRLSLAFMAYLAVRLEDLPVVLALGVRSGVPGTPEDVLAALRDTEGATLLAPAGLSDDAVGRLVRAELPGAEPEFVSACARVTGGNPFLTRELARALRADGIGPSSESIPQIEQLVPASVLRSVLTRIGRHGEEAQRVAAAVAVLGDGALLRHVTAVTGLEPGAAGSAADALAAASILAPGEPLRFAHPLIATAVHSDMASFARAEAHKTVAQVLAAEGAPVHELAAHLLLTTPGGDPRVVATLREAAARALAHGDPSAAARLLARAVAEPPPAADLAGVLLELARAESQAGDKAAQAHARQALELARERSEERVEALLALGDVHMALGDHAAAAEAVRAVLDTIGPADPRTQGILARHLSAHRFRASLLPEARERLAPFIEAARAGSPPEHPGLAAHVALELALTGARPDLVLRIAERAAAGEQAVDPGAHGLLMGLIVQALSMVDELAAAERIADAALAAARDQGSFMASAAGSYHRAIPRYHRGALAEALADLEQAQAPHREGWLAGAAWPRSLQVHVQIERGELAAARDTMVLMSAQAGPAGEAMDHAIILFASAALALATGDVRRGLADGEAAGASLRDGFGIDQPGFVPWRRLAALAAARVGEHRRAQDLARAELERAREIGVPRAIGLALRTAAALATASESRLELLGEAVAVLDESPSVLQRAHAQAELGRALRLAGDSRGAQAPLRAALQLADRMGAAPLATAVRDDLRATGARPRRAAVTGVDALTPAERRVCLLAAEGLTNPQIAEELVVTAKTVQTHLSHAFRKLGISSRRELPGVLNA